MEGEGYIYVALLFFLLVVVAILTGREVRRPPEPEEKSVPPGATACPSCGNVFYPKVQKKPKPSNPQPSTSPLILPGGSWPTYPGGGGPIVIYPSQGGGQEGRGGDE
jgi:hypothetical protein